MNKKIVALGACAIAGLALLSLRRTLNTFRHKHLEFDFPVEALDNLFV